MARNVQDDRDPLRECLESVVRSEFDSRTSIVSVDRSRSWLSSWYACDLVTVQLSTGRELKVWLKNFGSYRLVKEDMRERRERELRIYRDLLSEAGLGTARYYGCVWDESKGIFWLLLEYVDGRALQDYEFPYWVTAASWLGGMQGYIGQHADLLENSPFLADHDRHFFLSAAERALHSVSQLYPHLAGNLEEVLIKYDNLADTLLRQPRTLVHGDYTARQIIVDVTANPIRICPVDWEGAARGSSLFDLAILAHGFDPQRLDEILLAYRSELINLGVRPPELDELGHTINCVHLHRVVGWLSRAFEHRYPEARVTKLLDMAKQLAKTCFG
ncbi:MAG: aminoglycoside phosphotransferase family protein [Chloroflexi bacterium]|nr:aminoglycoside phosphotransferase family protein [Chloroflexota bacterium]